MDELTTRAAICSGIITVLINILSEVEHEVTKTCRPPSLEKQPASVCDVTSGLNKETRVIELVTGSFTGKS